MHTSHRALDGEVEHVSLLRGRWSFYQDPEDRAWRWRCVDYATGQIIRSQPCRSLAVCVADAGLYGFEASEPLRVYYPFTGPEVPTNR
jgi:hypothetical protein